MTELKVPAVVQPQTADDSASSVPTAFGDPKETLDSLPGKLHMPQVTSQPGSSHMRLGSRTLQTHKRIPSLPPTPLPDWSPIQQSKHVEPVGFNPSMSLPKLITIQKSDSNEDMVTPPALPEQSIGNEAFVTI